MYQGKLKRQGQILKEKKNEWMKEREDLQEELRRLRKREVEYQKSFSAKMNRVKVERDQFAADAATLQVHWSELFFVNINFFLKVEYQNLVDHVEQGMAEVAAQMAEAEAKKFDRQRQELEVALTEKVRLSSPTP